MSREKNAREDRSRPLHVAGAAPYALRLVEVDELVNRGGHLPIRCQLELEDGAAAGDWIVKPPLSSGDAESRTALGVLAELAGAEVCAWAGIPTPAIGVMRLPDPIPERHVEGRDALLRAQLELNAGQLCFCSRFLEDASEWLTERYRTRPRGRDLARAFGASLMLVDGYLLHDDRTAEKPNCLEWRGRVVPIDHGNAFAGLQNSSAVAAHVAVSRLTRCWEHHAFRGAVERAHKKLDIDQIVAALQGVSDADIRDLAARWPADLENTTTRSGRGIVSEMVVFLL